MAKADQFIVVGRVITSLPNTRFKVELENGATIIAHLSGKLRQYSIRVVPGDNVFVEMTTYDLTKGRIVWREEN